MAAALGMKDLSRDTQLFETFDTDKSGQLDTEELKAGLARLGLRQDCGWIINVQTVLAGCRGVFCCLQAGRTPVVSWQPWTWIRTARADNPFGATITEVDHAVIAACEDGQISYTEFLAATLCLDEAGNHRWHLRESGKLC